MYHPYFISLWNLNLKIAIEVHNFSKEQKEKEKLLKALWEMGLSGLAGLRTMQ